MIIRAPAVHPAVLAADGGNIGCGNQNSRIAGDGQDHGVEAGRSEVTDGTEPVIPGANIGLHIDPCADAAGSVPRHFRGQGRPPDVVGVCAPGNPCRSPVGAWNPVPAALGEDPSSVVKYHASKGFFAYPSPAGVGVDPVTDGVRSPGRIHAGLPAGTQVGHIHPAAVGSEQIGKLVKFRGSVLGSKLLSGNGMKRNYNRSQEGNQPG